MTQCTILKKKHAHLHIFATKRCIVGYGTGALWDFSTRSLATHNCVYMRLHTITFSFFAFSLLAPCDWIILYWIVSNIWRKYMHDQRYWLRCYSEQPVFGRLAVRNNVSEYMDVHMCSLYITLQSIKIFSMMTSSNGNIFRFTGPSWGEPLVTSGFPSQRSVTRSFDGFFDLRLNKRLANSRDDGRYFHAHFDHIWVTGCSGICHFRVQPLTKFSSKLLLGLGCWNLYSWVAMASLSYVVNIVAVDDLGTEGARASSAMLLTLMCLE